MLMVILFTVAVTGVTYMSDNSDNRKNIGIFIIGDNDNIECLLLICFYEWFSFASFNVIHIVINISLDRYPKIGIYTTTINITECHTTLNNDPIKCIKYSTRMKIE